MGTLDGLSLNQPFSEVPLFSFEMRPVSRIYLGRDGKHFQANLFAHSSCFLCPRLKLALTCRHYPYSKSSPEIVGSEQINTSTDLLALAQSKLALAATAGS